MKLDMYEKQCMKVVMGIGNLDYKVGFQTSISILIYLDVYV
jgi:hypothetical protein